MKLLFLLTLFLYSESPLTSKEIIIQKDEIVKWDDTTISANDKLIIYGTLKMKKGSVLSFHSNSNLIIKGEGTLLADKVELLDNSASIIENEAELEVNSCYLKTINDVVIDSKKVTIKEELLIENAIVEGIGRVALLSGNENFKRDIAGNVLVGIGSEKWQKSDKCDINKSIITVPEEFNSLGINVENNSVYLTWKSDKVINNSHFKVEYSHDGINYNLIEEFVIGNDQANQTYVFEILSSTIHGGSINYRLTKEDFEGNQMIYHKNVYFNKIK